MCVFMWACAHMYRFSGRQKRVRGLELLLVRSPKCWEMNSASLEEQQVVLAAELPFWPLPRILLFLPVYIRSTGFHWRLQL